MCVCVCVCVCVRACVRFYLASLPVTLLVEQMIKILFSTLECRLQCVYVAQDRNFAPDFKLVNSIATDTLDEQTTIYLGFNEVLIEI